MVWTNARMIQIQEVQPTESNVLADSLSREKGKSSDIHVWSLPLVIGRMSHK